MTPIKPHELRHATRCDGGEEHPTGGAGYYRVVAEDSGPGLSAPARNIVARAALVEFAAGLREILGEIAAVTRRIGAGWRSGLDD